MKTPIKILIGLATMLGMVLTFAAGCEKATDSNEPGPVFWPVSRYYSCNYITATTTVESPDDPILDRGICLGTSEDLLANSGIHHAGWGEGTYTCTINELIPGTHYFFCSFAKTSAGTTYGPVYSFITLPE
jgi:hypothetical protein